MDQTSLSSSIFHPVNPYKILINTPLHETIFQSLVFISRSSFFICWPFYLVHINVDVHTPPTTPKTCSAIHKMFIPNLESTYSPWWCYGPTCTLQVGMSYPTIKIVDWVLEGTRVMADMLGKPYQDQHYLQSHPRHAQKSTRFSGPSGNLHPLLDDTMVQWTWCGLKSIIP